MLTLNALGRHGGDLVKFLQSSLKDNENELKLLIDGPVQVEEIRRFLEPLGFADFVLEDDDGNLYLMTSKNSHTFEPAPKPVNPLANTPSPINRLSPPSQGAQEKILSHVSLPPMSRGDVSSLTEGFPHKSVQKNFNLNIQKSTGVLISCENKKYKKIFMQKVLSSLLNSKIKPEVLALMNDAVSLAAYNSPSCDYLKGLEDSGVKILISNSCADYLGITESIGAGTAVDMSEIFEEIFSCERIVNF